MMKLQLVVLLGTCVVLQAARPAKLKTGLKTENVKDNPDIYLSTTELIQKNGYPAESHEVTTEDGYILTMHRIPGGRQSLAAYRSGGRPVAFLQHGLLCSSSDWIMNTPEKALAYKLANEGYDVWMGNVRGNTYSRNHINLTTDDQKFWRFSWDEMGYYDLPAMLDYVLKTTGHEDLYYIGHSMGTTMFWVMTSLRPEYNAKIRLASALAPIAYVGHMVSPIRILAPFATQIEKILDMLGWSGEILASDGLIHYLAQLVGCDRVGVLEGICEDIIFLLAGFDSMQMNETELPVILGHTPAGTSVETLVHYAEEIDTGKFQRFDFGSKKSNQQAYGQDTPPLYDLSSVTAPVALYWSDNDWLGDPNDVYLTSEELPNLIRKFRVPLASFNHLDFLWAINADTLLYNDIMTLMSKY